MQRHHVFLYVLVIIVVWVSLFVLLFRERLNEGARNAHLLHIRKPVGLITYTFHGGSKAVPEAKKDGEDPDSMTIAGLAHCINCIRSLISDALYTNRMAILPPPGMMLQTSHNQGLGPIDQKKTWADYFDLSRLVTQKVIMDPTNLDYHQFEPIRGTVPDAVYVEADVNRDDLKAMDDPLIAVSHFQHPKYDPNKKIKFIACDCQEYSNYINAGDYETYDLARAFKPSDQVIQYSKMAHHDLMHDASHMQKLVCVHVRRGDILNWEDTVYGNGFTGHHIDQMTQGPFIAKALKEKIVKTSEHVTIMIFTNETSETWMTNTAKALKEAGYTQVKFESSLPTFKRIREETKDTFLCYEVAKQLFRKGDIRIATAEDRLGPSTHKLMDYL